MLRFVLALLPLATAVGLTYAMCVRGFRRRQSVIDDALLEDLVGDQWAGRIHVALAATLTAFSLVIAAAALRG